MKKSINFRLDTVMLEEIDNNLDNLYYNTRTEFVRKAILNQIEKERSIKNVKNKRQDK